MNELFTQVTQRVKTPISGYFFVSFVAINWDPLFYLFMYDVPVPLRIEYMHAHTNFHSAFSYPLLISIIYSTLYPWLFLLIQWATNYSSELNEKILINSELNNLESRRRLEELRADILRQKENAILEMASVDKAVNEINDEDSKNQVKDQLADVRNEEGFASKKNLLVPEIPRVFQNKAIKFLSTLQSRKMAFMKVKPMLY
ncbi:hypothetical protein [Rheinheimera sp.]|uniref:hypothetical protein n=1 Tax=Rheinheimera sp. TaxID=1869214 RepID=UPI00307E06B3